MSPLVLAALAASRLWAGSTRIEVVTFNVAGVPVVHPKINERIPEIARLIGEGGYDVVALQEVWRDRDALLLQKGSGMPHRARSPQQWPYGDGLLILSRWPILETESLAFDRRTEHPFRLDGEQVAHKGALIAWIQALDGPLAVVDTHLVSDYEHHANKTVRARQSHQLEEWLRRVTRGKRFVLAGDLNMTPEDPVVVSLRDGLSLTDACPACGPSNGGHRHDYIFLSPGAPASLQAQTAFDASITISGKPYRLSDHLAVVAVLQ